MESLHHNFLSPLILALPTANGVYTLETDACNKKVEHVLSQEQAEGQAKPVGYFSRSLKMAEKANDTMHSECLAVL